MLNDCQGYLPGCQLVFESEVADPFCPSCRQQRAQREHEREEARRKSFKPPTLSVNSAWQELADESGQYDDYAKRMRPGATGRK